MIDRTADLLALWSRYLVDPENVWPIFRDALMEEGLLVLHGPHGSRALITEAQARVLIDERWAWQEYQDQGIRYPPTCPDVRLHSYTSLGVSMAAICQVCPGIKFEK